MRFALINSRVDIRHYLPSNYSQVELPENIDATLIAGSDNAGWTMDGYVIPRLASGLYFAQEVTADDPAAHVLGQAFVALMRRQREGTCEECGYVYHGHDCPRLTGGAE